MAAPMDLAVGGEEKNENEEFIEDDKANQILSQYELFHRIFQNLSAKSLNTCCLVCKDWRREIEKIKSTRRRMSWMLYNKEQGRTHDDHSPITDLSRRIGNLPSQPRQVLLFSSLALDEWGLTLPASEATSPAAEPTRLPRAAKRPKPETIRVSMLQFLRDRLPTTCKVDGICASGIVGTDQAIGSPRELDKYNVHAGALLFLPDLPGVTTYNFTVTQPMERELEVTSGRAAVHSLTGIREDAAVRCVLYFRTEHSSFAEAELCDTFRRTYPGVVVAGGYVDQFIPEDEVARREDSYEDCSFDVLEPVIKGVAFCGDEVQVASVVLRSSVKSKKDMDEKLRQLKDTGIRVDRHTIGFMFACVGRGHHLHNAYNVEADLFKKHFPGAPLFGMFGNGEIGCDILPDYTNRKEGGEHAPAETETLPRHLPDMHLSYSTIFVVLSLPGGG